MRERPRRPMLYLMIAYLAGMFLRSEPIYLLSYTVVCTAATAYCYFRKSRLTVPLLIISMALAGATNYNLQRYSRSPVRKAIEDGRVRPNSTVEVYARVHSLLPTPDGQIAELSLRYLHLYASTMAGGGERLKLRCYSPQPHLKAGDTVRALVSPHTSGYLNPGTVVESASFTGTLVGNIELLHRGTDLWEGTVSSIRGALHHLISERLSENAASVVLASILGNRYFLSPQIEESFKQSGTYHVLIVSGSHIALLAFLLHLLLKKFHRGWRLALVLSAIWFYSAITGCDPPVLRAALMATLLLTGAAFFRKPDAANSLSTAGMLILALSPQSIHETGFQLTFIAVAALVLIVSPLQQHLESIGRWQPCSATPYPPECPKALKWLAETLYWSQQKFESSQAQYGFRYRLEKSALAALLERCGLQRPLRYIVIGFMATAIVQIALLPVSANSLHRLAPASLFLNLSAELAMAMLLLVFTLFITAATLGVDLSAVLELAVEVFLQASTTTLNGFRPAGLTPLGVCCIGVSVVLTMVLLCRWQPLAETPRSLLNRSLASAIALSILLAGGCGVRPENLPKGLRIDFLDVGQGDATLIRFPDGTKMLVDAGGQIGSKSRFKIGEEVVSRYLWHEGIQNLDYIAATHSDSDHMEGLLSVLENFSISTLILPAPVGTVPEFKALEQTAIAKGARIEVWQKGLQKSFGGASLQVLWPRSGNRGGANNDSLVLLITYGRRKVLLTGDIEAGVEAALVEQGLADVDALKVAHHGSRTSSTEAFLEAARPEVAVICAPRHSRFHHPHPEVLQRLKGRVLVTGRDGMVSLTANGEAFSVKSYLESLPPFLGGNN